MAYTKQNFKDGEVLTANNLSLMEDGIIDNINAINEVDGVVDYLTNNPTEGLDYILSDDKKYYICTGIGTCTDTEIVISPVYNGLPVKEIGASAFRTNAGKLLTKVTIPEGITKIGMNAFRDCAAITDIFLPNTLIAIDGYAFQKCTGLINLTIPDSVTTIGQSAFNICSGLTTLTIGKGIKQVAQYAFQGCEALTHIYFNATAMNNLNDKNYIFKLAGASSGVEFIVGKNVTRIPAHLMHSSATYSENPTIATLKFEKDSVCTSINESAFSGCTKLSKIEIPESVTAIGINAFNGCTGLAKVYFNAVAMTDLASNNHVFFIAGRDSETGIEIVIGKDVTYIPANLFHPESTNLDTNDYPNATLLSFEASSKCTRIGASAFSGCTNLKIIELPANLKTIGDSAFNGCTYLSTIYFNAIAMEDLLENNFVFTNAGHLEGHAVDVKIGQDVTRIPTHIFHPAKETDADNRPPNIVHVRFEENSLCETIGEHTFSNCPTLLDINIPQGVKTIGKNAFASCTGLTRIVLPDSVTEIVDYAFYKCTNLEYIEIPDSVLTIGKSALRDCHKLKHVRLPNKLKVLAKSMFEKTSDKYASVTESIQSVVIPKSVTTIEQEVFLNAVELRDIYYAGTEEEWYAIAIDSTVDEPNNDIDYLPLDTTKIHYNFTDDFVAVNNKIEAINSSGGVDLSGYQPKIDKNLSTTNKTIVGAINELNTKNTKQISATYNELKNLRDNAELIAGQFYRITDYVCTTTQTDTRASNHNFDIIVQALSNNTLSETAFADYHTYECEYKFDPLVIASQSNKTFEFDRVRQYYAEYIDFDADYSGLIQGSKSGDEWVAYDFKPNNEGVIVPIIYKTSAESYPDIPDYHDTHYYVGTATINGVTYDKWRKIESGNDWFDWETEAKKYVYTDRIVIPSADLNIANLSAWKLKYSLDNDTSRFAWADNQQCITNMNSCYSDGVPLTRQTDFDQQDNEYCYAWGTQTDVLDGDPSSFIYSKNEVITNGEIVFNAVENTFEPVEVGESGRGVIYYMKDEHNNECPYDFKNILFKDQDQYMSTFNDSQKNFDCRIRERRDGDVLMLNNIRLGMPATNLRIENNCKNIYIYQGVGGRINNVTIGSGVADKEINISKSSAPIIYRASGTQEIILD